MWLDSWAQLLNAESRFAEALVAAEDLERRFAFLPCLLDTPAVVHRAIALHGLGRRDEALVAARDGLEQARPWGSPGVVGQALRVLGTVEGGDPGIIRLRQAVAATGGTRARLELAEAQVQLGAALRASGAANDARPALRAGLELAAELGAESLEARARRELHAAGGRPRTTALTGPGSLTAAERRVAELAAAGDTNRAIGEALFVTPKTVELHLSNVYRKLGIRGRRELAGALTA